MTFDVDYAIRILPTLLNATVVTFQATIWGMTFAVVGGLVLAILRMSRFRPVSATAGFYIEFIRSTPLLTQLFFLFYILPLYGLALSAFVTGVLALGLHYSSYTAEVYRAGITGVPRGQWEAATTLNLGPLQTWRLIILPQAIPPVIPALGNYLVSMFKDTPLLATITVLELLGTALTEAGLSFRYLEPITIVGAIFLALSLPSALLVRGLERRFATR
ncbi:MAG: ectoine/hydroxyectoine ABC transporter permease subunit EhuD [Chloroflexi bacterium]|nr:ectoine/hydroxyectoine ABC transporter permease subunit EhuD [Chloroflexota bacterium]